MPDSLDEPCQPELHFRGQKSDYSFTTTEVLFWLNPQGSWNETKLSNQSTDQQRLGPCGLVEPSFRSLDISTSPSVTHNHPASQVLRGLSGCGAGRGDVEPKTTDQVHNPQPLDEVARHQVPVDG